MDDLELLRRCYAEPNNADSEFRAALATRPGAARAATQAQQLDRDISKVLAEVEYPAGLEGRIILRADLRAARRPSISRLLPLSLVAAILLTLGAALRYISLPQYGSIGDEAVAHVYREIAHLDHQLEVTDASMDRLMRKVGIRRIGQLDKLRFAALCPSGQGSIMHLVLAGERGPVTVLYMPQRQIGAITEIADSRFHGRAYPKTHGSLAVIGELGEPLERIHQLVDAAVDWRA